MKRKDFLKFMGIGVMSTTVDLTTFAKSVNKINEESYKMPVLFIGHGSPMNAIEDNDFTRTLSRLGKALPRPRAILCISAHWCTNETYVSVAEKPKMIYDMYGFPDELYRIEYPANGYPSGANEVLQNVKSAEIKPDEKWGFDHGCWSIMKHIFPEADVPLFQMSIDYYKHIQFHYNLGKELAFLREKGILIIGSGNLTHNLRIADFRNIDAKPFDWAMEFDQKIKKLIDERQHKGIIEYDKLGYAAKLSVPEPSHYIPLVYALALQEKNEEANYIYDKFQYGSLSMRCVKIG